VVDDDSQKRLSIDMTQINKNLQVLRSIVDWPEKLLEALKLLDGEQQERFSAEGRNVDALLYDGFMNDQDAKVMAKIRTAHPDQLESYIEQAHDNRIKQLLPLYKARNFPRKLTTLERADWEAHKAKRLSQSRLTKYFESIERLQKNSDLTEAQKSILEDLVLYGQSIMPTDLE
jgi:exodeoxyribonuclease-1